MHIVLVKRTDVPLEGARADAVRSFLFGDIDGATEKDQRAWRRFVRALHEAGSGEFFSVKIERQRSNKFHRLHMKMMTEVFRAQERIEDFEQFRLWTKIGSGFVTWMAGPKGGVFPVPKSISYAECDQIEFIEFHNGVVQFLRTAHAQHYLFPHLAPQLAEQGIEKILSSFDRSPS